MTENSKRKGASLIAFVIGVALGKKGLPILAHAIYLTIIVLLLAFGSGGPVSAYMSAYGQESVVEDLETCNERLEETEEELEACNEERKKNGAAYWELHGDVKQKCIHPDEGACRKVFAKHNLMK